MISSTKAILILTSQILIGFAVGVVVACSPTKFSTANDVITTGDGVHTDVQNCAAQGSYTGCTSTFKIGSGKVDILFVDDNSASMSFEQKNMAAKFGGFVEALDRKQIDYRIAITTTDLNTVSQKKLITLGNGKSFLTNADSNRVGLFNSSVVRQETVACESYIKGIINTYGSGWRSASEYQANYSKMCPSSDERGTYTSFLVLNENTDSFMRADANLNIIAISDEDVRSASGNLEANDKYDTFISMMGTKYPSKYWEFNSIIVKDNSCMDAQSKQIVDQQGQSAVSSSIGYEYAKLSNSAALSIDGSPRPRGQILDICQSDYTQHFSTIATQISESSRLRTLLCKPESSPTVTNKNNASLAVPFTWDGDTKIVFGAGTEGTEVVLSYRCYTGGIK